MNYWLVKTEPGDYSWDDLLRDGSTCWDGVRNYQARNFMKEMKSGDSVLVYHSVGEKQIVGLAEVCRPYYQDPTTDDQRWVAVDIKPVESLKSPVSLQQIKEDKRLADMLLVRNSRLSVMPLDQQAFQIILNKSK